jgi:hypothetical protein
MGTNYYLKQKCCASCGRSDERHIGKSSAGWCFGLHVYPDDGINTLEDWRKLFSDQSNKIRDEYGSDVEPQEMLNAITNRSWVRNQKPMMYRDWSEFNRLNHATEGPNGLSRHQIDGRHCIGHGEGTWDYLIGDFS